ncbi:hypothetical protein HPB52_025382 [Rhipicephalus sanguineus]|uniref:Uncharacterized protein n=1 Tax=Rhipicephalus sanguineus TaxID=34632 RepID=A0A9D4TD08_RHISA|nr:hypothetical protein HPB52_025382 [Rhipicephalus sanguineus]
MKKGSAPGPDGLPVEFYIEFWPIIDPFMSRVIRRCFHDLSLPHSFRSWVNTDVDSTTSLRKNSNDPRARNGRRGASTTRPDDATPSRTDTTAQGNAYARQHRITNARHRRRQDGPAQAKKERLENSGPQSSHLPTVYRALLAFHRRLETTCPEMDVAEAKVVDTMAALVQPLVPRHRQAIGCNDGRWYAAPLARTASWLRLTGMRRSNASSPDFLGVRSMLVFVDKVSEGHFAALLLVAGLFSLWRNRCEAVAGNCRRRALWPILVRMRREILAFLSEELFFLGEREFLPHWSCPFVGVERDRVQLIFRPTWC